MRNAIDAKIFKSLDPTWPMYGVSPLHSQTRWFRTKAAAEKFLKTGNDKQAIAGRMAR